MGSWTPKLRPH